MPNKHATAAKETSSQPSTMPSQADVARAIVRALAADAPDDATRRRDDYIRSYLSGQVAKHSVATNYNVLVLFDHGMMVKSDADHIYSAAAKFDNSKPILLVLRSTGGVIGSAYLIGKLCREYAENKLVIVVPREAKSGATLLCCAADEIHMGSLSELGPIDPQMEGLPALGLKSSIEHIADLVRDHPHSADMFAKYLHMSLKPVHLGYYERVAESATQYAERLLKTHTDSLKNPPAVIARNLVYSYKDHGFVIDQAEAADIFGDSIVKTKTPEYGLGNAVYEAMQFVRRIADAFDHYFYFIGSCDSRPHFTKRQE